MKKKVFSLLFILIGSSLWWALANTARFSIKKWDAKFNTVLRHSLNELDLSAKDLVSSLHKIEKDERGEWIRHQVSLGTKDKDRIKKIRTSLEKSGATVTQIIQNQEPVLHVRRGSRIYQEIRFVDPLPSLKK